MRSNTYWDSLDYFVETMSDSSLDNLNDAEDAPSSSEKGKSKIPPNSPLHTTLTLEQAQAQLELAKDALALGVKTYFQNLAEGLLSALLQTTPSQTSIIANDLVERIDFEGATRELVDQLKREVTYISSYTAVADRRLTELLPTNPLSTYTSGSQAARDKQAEQLWSTVRPNSASKTVRSDEAKKAIKSIALNNAIKIQKAKKGITTITPNTSLILSNPTSYASSLIKDASEIPKKEKAVADKAAAEALITTITDPVQKATLQLLSGLTESVKQQKTPKPAKEQQVPKQQQQPKPKPPQDAKVPSQNSTPTKSREITYPLVPLPQKKGGKLVAPLGIYKFHGVQTFDFQMPDGGTSIHYQWNKSSSSYDGKVNTSPKPTTPIKKAGSPLGSKNQ